MSKLLKYAWDDTKPNWLESDHQIAICRCLDAINLNILPKICTEPVLRRVQALSGVISGRYTYEGDQNASRRSYADAASRKAQGMKAGSPDMRFYLDGGRFFAVELKRKGGKLTEDQKKRIALLRSLGHTVYVVTAITPEHGVLQILDILERQVHNG